LASLQNQLVVVTKANTDLTTEVLNLQNQVAQASQPAQNVAVNAQITDLTNQNQALTAQVASLQNQLSGAATPTQEVTDLNAKLSSLTEDLDSANATIKSQDAEILDLQTKLAAATSANSTVV
jgi:chromosome segregation ATPase